MMVCYADDTSRLVIMKHQLMGRNIYVSIQVHELTVHFQMGRTGVAKHLTVLKEAGLVHDRKVGRETRYRLDATPLREVQDWVDFYSKYWHGNMMRLNELLEEEN